MRSAHSVRNLPPPRFNCAAPFRERLSKDGRRNDAVIPASIVPLPFGSGYARYRSFLALVILLQLCRSLSGAVIPRRPQQATSVRQASIVPLPFGSGYI